MEKKKSEQCSMTLPMYESQVPPSRKRWIVGMGFVALLAGMIAMATLVGVYMTQKHMEKMMTMVLNARDGHRVQQTISANEQENMAAIFVHSKNNSATMLYDYKRNIIGVRTMNSSACYLLRMDRSKTPSIQDIIRQMDIVRTRNASSDAQITYSVIPERTADPIDVGMDVNILCGNGDIYWAKLMRPKDVKLLGVGITFTFAFSITIEI